MWRDHGTKTTYSFGPEQNFYSFKDCFRFINECMHKIQLTVVHDSGNTGRPSFLLRIHPQRIFSIPPLFSSYEPMILFLLPNKLQQQFLSSHSSLRGELLESIIVRHSRLFSNGAAVAVKQEVLTSDCKSNCMPLIWT